MANTAGSRNSSDAPEPAAAPRGRGQQYAREIDHERDVEHEPAAETIGEPAEHQRAKDGARYIGRAGGSDVLRGEPQRLRVLKHRADGADDRDFETIEDPCHAERHDDEQVEAAPGQPVEARRNVRADARRRRLLPGCASDVRRSKTHAGMFNGPKALEPPSNACGSLNDAERVLKAASCIASRSPENPTGTWERRLAGSVVYEGK
jgi:hypothetical protein